MICAGKLREFDDPVILSDLLIQPMHTCTFHCSTFASPLYILFIIRNKRKKLAILEENSFV